MKASNVSSGRRIPFAAYSCTAFASAPVSAAPRVGGPPELATIYQAKEAEPLSEVLKRAGKRALGGGLPGAAAMGIQVLSLMWLRTTVNYQYRYGTTTTHALKTLYREGGVLRFYRGLGPALIQGPLSRFGDTAANAGSLALLDSYESTKNLNVGLKTLVASTSAGLFRIFLMPVDACKTILQVEGKDGLKKLRAKIAKSGPTVLYHGALASAFATFAGHAPWFGTYNYLNEALPQYDALAPRLCRSAFIGFSASLVSDTVSNSIRVVKTSKQAATEAITYPAVIRDIIAKDGVLGLFGRGLKTKILSNGLQGLLFSVLWRMGQDLWNKNFVTEESSKSASGDHFRWAAIGSPLMLPGQTVRGDPWLCLSSLGIGSYLGEADAVTDELVTTAVLNSLNAGWNVIDTAANYRWGRAEAAIGEAMQALRSGPGISTIQRTMLFVSTKAGFVDEELLAAAGIAAGSSDVADGSHCVHPKCLGASLDRSLRLLKMSTVDILYLHNAAEAQLQRLGAEGFEALLRAAFAWLEGTRRRGSIQAYGLASWDCFRKPPGTPGYLSLARVVQLAEAVGGADHGFRYVQLPVSAAMPEAWQGAWQKVGAGSDAQWLTLLKAAARLGVNVFASAPLAEGSLLRNETLKARAEAATELGGVKGAAPKLLHFARSTPLVLSTLVGHKQADHVSANLEVSQLAPLSPDSFRSVVRTLGV
ncbi:hypothetical protein WJX81_000061 [Elliptochloris bilobata]|uniref:NADP-dependent oxidoreductase domain-containing protein n=1 Tax=Elliptochloris bilobata TaxID=381761 RepID=A0AAW1QKA5_9CHLO